MARQVNLSNLAAAVLMMMMVVFAACIGSAQAQVLISCPPQGKRVSCRAGSLCSILECGNLDDTSWDVHKPGDVL
jgi:hypothetical protein